MYMEKLFYNCNNLVFIQHGMLIIKSMKQTSQMRLF